MFFCGMPRKARKLDVPIVSFFFLELSWKTSGEKSGKIDKILTFLDKHGPQPVEWLRSPVSAMWSMVGVKSVAHTCRSAAYFPILFVFLEIIRNYPETKIKLGQNFTKHCSNEHTTPQLKW